MHIEKELFRFMYVLFTDVGRYSLKDLMRTRPPDDVVWLTTEGGQGIEWGGGQGQDKVEIDRGIERQVQTGE